MAKTYTKNYDKPELNGHRVLYKGRRYWAIEIDADHPFEIFDQTYGDLVVWDGFIGAAITEGKIGDDGIIRGSIQYGQGSIDVKGKTVREFVDDVIATCDWIQREVDQAVRQESKPLYNGRVFQIIRGFNLKPPRAGLHIVNKASGKLIGTAQAKDGGAWEGIVNGETLAGKNFGAFKTLVQKTLG